MINCIFENGNRASLRHVTAGAIVVNDRNEVLLVKRSPHLLNGNKYAIPGGFLDRGENTEEAALRELKEETGYEGKIEHLFQIVDNPDRPKEDRQNVDFRYVVKIIGGEMKDNIEVSSVRWVELDKLPTDEDSAFDHIETVKLYKKYLENKFTLPVRNWEVKA